MTANDFLIELQNRGFESYGPVNLVRYLNMGGRYVANRTRAFWEVTNWPITVTAGNVSVDLSTLTGVKSVDRVIGTTDGFRRKLNPLDDDSFFKKWLPMDLTAAGNRNEPSGYFIDQQKLWIIPPPVNDRTFTVYGRRRWVDLDPNALSGTPITPVDCDEAILTAALIRCHLRSNEWDIATTLRGDLEEAITLILDEDELLMDEQQERTEPDHSWL